MVGLDGYMLIRYSSTHHICTHIIHICIHVHACIYSFILCILSMHRYINICFRMSLFVTIWGILVLAPVYSIAGSPSSPIIEWNRYTIANISNTTERIQIELWVPSLFVYIFSSYFCYLMYNEYKHFALHRIEYLIFGDDDTPEQTYYTVLVEKLPGKLRTELELTNFFEKLFPNDVHSVEIALDLDELDILIAERKNVRNHLEKSIAILKGTSRRSTVYIHSDFYKDISEPLVPLSTNRIISWFGYNRYDAIHHYNRVLQMLNDDVADQQRLILHNIEHGKQMDRNRVREEEEEDNQDMYTRHTKSHASTATSSSINSTRSHAAESYTKSVNSNSSISASESSDGLVSIVERFFDKLYGYNSTISKKYDSSSATTAVSGNGTDSNRIPFETYQTSRVSYSANTMSANGVSIVQSHAYTHDSIDTNDTTASTSGSVGALDIFPSRIMSKAVEGVEGLSKKALKGALKGMLEATRTLELLTVGAYYRTSTTAFVTLKSRVSTNLSHQMLLSHEHNVLQVVAAPNPKDIIVDNISLPRRQINTRIYIADGVLIVGAIFWSFVVGFIATISNLETISKERGWEWLQSYNKTTIFIFLNNYLALGLLLVLLATLPVLFDIIARNYEGLKLESEIQNSIMNRYFYYQLANVFVSVGLGSLASSLHQILNKPSSIFNILGSTVPSFSTYFANLLVVKSFTAVPIEMLRLYSLFEYLSVKTCVDKRTCTRRELRTGAFADPPMLYGWIYPNLLMVLMIMLTYCCIAPLLMPFCMIFFAFAYAMYKYQLLYVYINDYQSGGYMWYAVFKHSMVGLICGVVTLICYMGIRDSVNSGPFYLITPLPVFIIFFWRYCEAKYKLPSMHLSLESAIDIDHIHSVNRADGKKTPQDAFSKYLFRQSSLRK